VTRTPAWWQVFRRPLLPYSALIRTSSWGGLLRSPSLWCLTISYGLVGYFQYLFFYWAQYYFETIQALPRETGRRYATLLSLAMGAGMVAGGWLSDRAAHRLGPRRGLALVPILGLLLATGAVFLGLTAPTSLATLACFLAAMAGAGMSEGSYWTASVRLGGPRAGAASAIMNTGGNLGGLLAPALTPIISSLLGWKAGLGVAGLVCLAGAALWPWIDPEERPT
jgi:predicted MFS family arabinose efflux permease